MVRDRWRTDGLFRLGVVLVGLVVGAAAFAPWPAPHDPWIGDRQNAYVVEPGGRFVLGTDTQGRDVVSRVLFGVLVGVISQSVAVTLRYSWGWWRATTKGGWAAW